MVQDFSLTPVNSTASATPGTAPSTNFQWAINRINGFSDSVSHHRTPRYIDPQNPDPASYRSQRAPHLSKLTYNWTVGSVDKSPCTPFPSSGSNGAQYTLLVRVFGSTQLLNHSVNTTRQRVPGHRIFQLLITVDPVNPIVAPGGVVTYTFTVNKSGNFSGSVAFNILGSPNCGYVVAAPSNQVQAGSSTTLQFNTTGCPTGNTYQFSISGYNLNTNQTVYVSPTLTIGSSAPPDFSLKSSPSTAMVTPGAGTVYTLNVAPSYGFTGGVTLAVSSLPSGVTASFPAGATVIGSGTSRAATPEHGQHRRQRFSNDYGNGHKRSLAHSTTLTLTINAPQADFSIDPIPHLPFPRAES